jgi:calcineurin-like phosphoesterase family protein
MPNIWCTADFHFGHSNIIRYCNRPFRSVEEMDQSILDRLNASVKANDILYFLGDFCIESKAKALWSTASRFAARKSLRCRVITTNKFAS